MAADGCRDEKGWERGDRGCGKGQGEGTEGVGRGCGNEGGDRREEGKRGRKILDLAEGGQRDGFGKGVKCLKAKIARMREQRIAGMGCRRAGRESETMAVDSGGQRRAPREHLRSSEKGRHP